MNAELYNAYKPLLFSIAYRLLGSVMDAEDLVHDVFVDWERVEAKGDRSGQVIEQAKAYLCRMVTNRAVDQLRAAKRRRARYVGEWLPEPLVSDAADHADSAHVNPLQHVLLQDSLSMAYLVMLEALSPIERAVFLLRETYAYDYEEIAGIIDRKADNCRQILTRARRKLRIYDQTTVYPKPQDGRAAGSSESAASAASANQQVLAKFMHFVTEGNIDGLLSLMTDNAVFVSDGGGKVLAAINPILGRDRVARFVLGIASKLNPHDYAVRAALVNGTPGIVITGGDTTYCTMAFEYAGGRIAAILNTMNPDKLKHIASRAR